MSKLKHYGLDNSAISWFKSYLTDRKQYVEIDGIKSSTKNLTTGVPQGSTLGPLLFIIYMNDINNVSDTFKSILFADDTSLSIVISLFQTQHNTRRGVSTHINQELAKITNWLRANRLSLNVSKTKYMLFRYPKPPSIPYQH